MKNHIAPNVHRKMILARRSSPAPSARHICRTKTKKTKSLTCLRHPLPSDGRGTKPRRGGIFFDNSPAFQGWDSSRTNIKVPSGTADFSSLTGLVNLPGNLPSHKWLGYFRMMSLLTELDSFTPPFLQICQSYGLRRLRVLRAAKIQTPIAPIVQPKMKTGKEALTISNCEFRIAERATSP